MGEGFGAVEGAEGLVVELAGGEEVHGVEVGEAAAADAVLGVELAEGLEEAVVEVVFGAGELAEAGFAVEVLFGGALVVVVHGEEEVEEAEVKRGLSGGAGLGFQPEEAFFGGGHGVDEVEEVCAGFHFLRKYGNRA